MKLTCPTCDGMGQERRKITHPMANVAGWHREGEWPSPWWRRRCERCAGDGEVDAPVASVPLIPKQMAKD